MASRTSIFVLVAILTVATVYANAPIDFDLDTPFTIDTIQYNTTFLHLNAETDKDYGLDDNEWVPTKYVIEVTIPDNFATEMKFSGKVVINLIPRTGITVQGNNLRLHVAGGIKVSKYEVKENTNAVTIVTKGADATHETQEIEFSTKTQVVGKLGLILTAEYSGELQKDMSGLYLSQYKVDKVAEHLLATQFQPTSARKFMPCFDEPQFKATFTITVTYPNDYKVLSNAEPNGTPTGDNQKTLIFKETPPMSTYLLAIAITKYDDALTRIHDGVKHSVWNRHDPELGMRREFQALQYSMDLLHHFDNYTKIEYKEHMKLDKVDHIAIPDFSAGAMENWGLVTYRESQILYENGESTTKNLQRLCSIISHELSHFWFGNYVTTQSWSNTWLNEGFARYFQYFGCHAVEKEWELDRQFVIEQHMNVMNADSLPSSKSLNSEAASPAAIKDKFSAISYNKGASIIRMMSYWMTPTQFQNHLQKYLTKAKTAGGVVVPNDLWEAVDTSEYNLPTGIQLKDVMQKYVEKPGLPLIYAELKDKKVTITQKGRFLLSKPETPKAVDDKEMYYVPVTFSTNDDGSFDYNPPKPCWLKQDGTSECNPIELKKEDETIIVNINAAAYARVNYDDTLWDRIITTLNKDKFGGIDVINRAVLIDDAMNLARAGEIKYERALKLLEYLENETRYYPWYSALTAFQYLLRRLPSDSTESRDLKAYILLLMKNIDGDGNESSHITALKKDQSASWRCNLGDKGCIKTMLSVYEDMRKLKRKVTPDLRSTVYCTAIRFDESKDDDSWNYFFNKMQEENLIASEVDIIISALGCTKKNNLHKKYLGELLKTDKSVIRDQDATQVFAAVAAGSSEGLDAANVFLQNKDNLTELKNRFDKIPGTISSMVSNVIDRFTTKDQVEKFRAFLTQDPPSFAEEAKKMLDSAEKNIEWMNKEKGNIGAYVSTFLRNRSKDPSPPPADPGASGSTVASIVIVICNLFIVFYVNNK